MLFMFLWPLMFGCIKPYNPDILGSDAKKYVIMGSVTNCDTLQNVNISLTSSINEPEYIPVLGCKVIIYDNDGNAFEATDEENGNYSIQMDPWLVKPGKSFMIDVTSPSGERIVSTYDTVYSCPPVDSVYYLRKDVEGATPDDVTKGIQFYVDLNGNSNDSRYYLFEEYETWEYHTEYPIEWWYDGEIHHVFPPDYSKKVCWKTLQIPIIYTLTTKTLTENSYKLFPTHFVDNKTNRLAIGYSLLVKQIALSATAYIFWNQMEANNKLGGELYETQPLSIRGNLSNLTNPEHEVLGFFGAYNCSKKRIFIHVVPDLPLEYNNYCEPRSLLFGLKEIHPRFYPAYLMGDSIRWYPVWLLDECVDCLFYGGINVKPEFWPN